MLLDAYNQFSSAQAVTATAISTNVIDLGPLFTGNLVRDLGAGEELNLTILVTTTTVSAGSTTLVVTLESDDNVGLTSSTVHWTSATIAKATLVAGYFIAQGLAIPPGSYERYLGLRYTVAVANFSAGNFYAWLHKGRFDTRVYAGSFTNSV